MGLMLVPMTSWLKSCQKVEKSSRSPKKLQKSERFVKVIGSEERLPKYQSSVNWIWRTRASVRALTVFWALFAGPSSSLNTKFGAITVKTMLMVLLVLCYVFSPEELVSFKPLCTEKTRRLYSQYLHIGRRTPATTQSLSSFDRLTLEGFIDGFHDGISTKRAPVTIWPSSLSAYMMSRCKMHLKVFIPTNSIISVWDPVYTSKFCSSCATV